MAATAPTVAVVGMAALRRDLRRLADDQSSPIYTAIKAAGKAAAEPVAGRARGAYPHASGTLAGSVRTSGTRTGAAVRVGSARVPYAGWIDFGGDRPDGSHRDYMPGGRYLFPAAVELAGVAANTYSTAIDRALGDPAIWTNTTTDPGAIHD